MQITVRFDVRRVSKNELACDIGSQSVYGASKEELTDRLIERLQKMQLPPQVACVRMKGDTVILLEHMGSVDTYRFCNDDDGVAKLRCSGTSCLGDGESLASEARKMAVWMAQQSCDINDPPPEWLNDDERQEWIRWQRWQIAYKTAIDVGYESGMAHIIACEHS